MTPEHSADAGHGNEKTAGFVLGVIGVATMVGCLLGAGIPLAQTFTSSVTLISLISTAGGMTGLGIALIGRRIFRSAQDRSLLETRANDRGVHRERSTELSNELGIDHGSTEIGVEGITERDSIAERTPLPPRPQTETRSFGSGEAGLGR